MNDCKDKDKELCKDIRMKDVRKTWGGGRGEGERGRKGKGSIEWRG
jgi:hypothetical protein